MRIVRKQKKVKTAKYPTEAEEQEAFVEWLSIYGIAHFAAPSSFFGDKSKRFYGMIAKLKKQGWSSGWPDLVILLPGKVLFIEMKRIKGGVVSEQQKAWHKALADLNYDVYVCNGAEDAIACVKQYL